MKRKFSSLPEAGFYVWIDVSRLGESGEVVKRLIRDAKVSSNDGSFYGDCGRGYIRLITGCFWNDEDCFAALRRMAEVFTEMAAERGISE